MTPPRSRRTVLASIAATAALATGGFEYNSSRATGASLESGTVPADRYDCSDVDRPEPDSSDDEAALEPLEYPTLPSEANASEDHSPADGSRSPAMYGASRYVTEFERAYQRNAFLVQYGSMARVFDLHRTAYRTVPIDSTADGDAVLVAIRYNVTRGHASRPRTTAPSGTSVSSTIATPGSFSERSTTASPRS
ncbi:hypothetical protein [Natrinema sp. SYSU A 869]|uniref:hypothetical protein n=1 Tax=Natrinema sp. SYSU A 869 TaxID=2871694 RepID=UPI002106E594|nr:hypothetical protein [Natrinema sp. SYSU A 869]